MIILIAVLLFLILCAVAPEMVAALFKLAFWLVVICGVLFGLAMVGA